MRRFLPSAAALAFATVLAAADAPPGYLAPGSIDLTQVLPPAPVKGDIRYETDRKVFKAMKAKIGSDRWKLATADVDYQTPTMMRDFSCAAGIALSPTATPATWKVLVAANADTGRANNDAKQKWQRLRPFRIDPGETCEDKKELGNSYDYPSGHTTKGWTFGLVLAEALPDRATPILARARAYGESRIVCRVHNFSAVENGRLGATVTMESVRETAAYQADIAAAKAELARLRASGPAPDATTCAAEQAQTAQSVMTDLK